MPWACEAGVLSGMSLINLAYVKGLIQLKSHMPNVCFYVCTVYNIAVHSDISNRMIRNHQIYACKTCLDTSELCVVSHVTLPNSNSSRMERRESVNRWCLNDLYFVRMYIRETPCWRRGRQVEHNNCGRTNN